MVCGESSVPAVEVHPRPVAAARRQCTLMFLAASPPAPSRYEAVNCGSRAFPFHPPTGRPLHLKVGLDASSWRGGRAMLTKVQISARRKAPDQPRCTSNLHKL